MYDIASDPTVTVSADRIMDLVLGFRRTKVLCTAVELDLFTNLANGPADAETLQQRLGLAGRGAKDFFDALVALGVIERDNGRYRNSADADLYLDRTKPTYIGDALELASQRLHQRWQLLTHALRNGAMPSSDTPNPFEAMYCDPVEMELFLRGIAGLSLPVAHALARRPAWSGCKHFVDVGSGAGALGAVIAAAHPHLTGAGFDLPPVKPVFDRYIGERRLAERVKFHPGNFFEDPLPTADVLIMGHILHDWDLPVKKMLLKKAYTALPPGGVLIVYDQMIDDERRTNDAGLLMSLSMLLMTPGGFDYTGRECLAWVHEAGFDEAQIATLVGPYSMLVGTK